jgi:hypothetical protein
MEIESKMIKILKLTNNDLKITFINVLKKIKNRID